MQTDIVGTSCVGDKTKEELVQHEDQIDFNVMKRSHEEQE